MATTGQWTSIGPSVIRGGIDAVGRLSAIAIDPIDPDILYVGGRACGVWKTVDAGLSWSPIADSLPTLAIAAIAIDPTNTQRLYVGVEDLESESLGPFESIGIFSSMDAGDSWQQTSPSIDMQHRFGKLIVNPSSPAVLYATSLQGVQRSIDSGVNWSISLAMNFQATDLVMDARNPDILYASGEDGVFKTTTGGASSAEWSLLSSGLPGRGHQQVTLAQCRQQPDTLFAGYRLKGDGVRFQLYRTVDAGANWTEQFSTTNSEFFNDYIGVDPDDPNVVYATGQQFFRSEDAGQSFVLSKGPHVDHHDFAADPQKPGVIFTACDGGLYRSADRAKKGTWEFVSEGLSNVEFFDTASSFLDRSLVFGGTMDNGSCRSRKSGTIWDGLDGGDVKAVAVDPTNVAVLYYVGLNMGEMFRNNHGGDPPWNEVSADELSECEPWNGEYKGEPKNHLLVHPSDSSIILATCGPLWQGPDWNPILRPTTGEVSRVAVEASSNLYMAGTTVGDVFAGIGGVFTQAQASLGGRRVLDIEFDPNDSRTAYAAVTGRAGNRVFQIQISPGPPIELLTTPISNGLPSGETVLTLAVDRLRSTTIYAGTRHGVFQGSSIDGGATWSWTDYNDGLPRARVSSLTVQSQTGLLRVGTFGRGAYEVETDTPLGAVMALDGTPTFLRVNEVGGRFGPRGDQIEAEVVVRLDTDPDRAFGFKLRRNGAQRANLSMFHLLRDAFHQEGNIRVEFIRTGLNNGEIIRVVRAI